MKSEILLELAKKWEGSVRRGVVNDTPSISTAVDRAKYKAKCDCAIELKMLIELLG